MYRNLSIVIGMSKGGKELWGWIISTQEVRVIQDLIEREETENERPFGYWFGFLSSDSSDLPKFVFTKETNEVLVKWFNNIYEDFNKEETKIIWENISAHPEIKEISNQLWYELEMLVKYDEEWSIC